MKKKFQDLTEKEVIQLQARKRVSRMQDIKNREFEREFWEEFDSTEVPVRASSRVNDDYDFSHASIAKYFDKIA